MANSVIQIKRSTTDAVPANVVFGELAYTANGKVLYIGDETNTAIAIAGNRTPGVLTANQAIVVDENSIIDNINANTLNVLQSATIDVLTVTGSANIEGLSIGSITIGNNSNFSSLNATDITVSNTLTVNGDILLRGSSLQLGDGGDVISLGASVNSSIIPSTNNTYDLGSSTSFWRRLFTNEIREPADAPLNVKLDILWKKIGFNKTSTDYITSKLATEETIDSNLIIAPSEIWTKASSIPSSKPVSNSGVVVVYNEVELTEDETSTSLRTWKSNIINWIPPRFGTTYNIVAYMDTAGSTNPASNGTLLSQTGSGNNDEWYFDYQSGVLHFIGTNLPSGLDGTKSVFITGAKYNGTTGFNSVVLNDSELVNATITSLSTPLEVKDGGTGVNAFTSNSILAAANSSSLSFKTGSNGQIMIITDNDVGFGDLDGGTY